MTTGGKCRRLKETSSSLDSMQRIVQVMIKLELPEVAPHKSEGPDGAVFLGELGPPHLWAWDAVCSEIGGSQYPPLRPSPCLAC